MNPGDIALIHFPFSVTEDKPFKLRPVLIVGVAPGGNAADGGYLVAMITSSAERVANPGRNDVPLVQSETSRLIAPSVCRANRLWVAESRDFDRVVGAVLPTELEHIKATVADMFDLR